MKYSIKNSIILFTSIFMIFIIFSNFFFKNKEGFDIKDVNKMFSDVKNMTKTVSDVPSQIKKVDDKLVEKVNKLTKQIEQKTEAMGKKIEENTTKLLKDKLGSIFTQLGNIFNEGLVKPILDVFKGIGDIFVQIFNIVKEIGNKIVSLPNCIFTYAIKSTIDSCYFFYNKIMPKFIKNIFSFIYDYTLSYVFDFIGYLTGYSDSVKRCYGFNVSTQVDNIKESLGDIQSTFKKDFGRLNFSKIKI